MYDMYDEQYEREYAWEHEEDERDFDEDGDEIQFADPGGNSALRAGVRDQRCPSCKFPNRLTMADVRLGYQCDRCADAQERGIDAPYNDEYDEEGGDGEQEDL